MLARVACWLLWIALATPLAAGDKPAEDSAVVRVTLLDEATNEPLPDAYAALFPTDDRSLAARLGPRRDREGDARVIDAPPGRYVLVAHRRAKRLDGLTYEPADGEKELTLGPGETVSLNVSLRARPLTLAEIEDRAPLLAFGRVTDANGEPIADATVRVATGWGTLLGGGTARTNADGEYVLRFGLGILMMDSRSQLQVAQFWVEADGYLEKSRSKRYQRMALMEPEAASVSAGENVFVKDRDGRIDFVLAESATLRARVVSADGSTMRGAELRIESPTEENPAKPRDRADRGAASWDVPPGVAWRFTLGDARSVGFRLPEAGSYEAVLRFREFSGGAPPLLELIEVRDALGRAVAFSPGDDPFAEPPLPPDAQRGAEELLARVIDRNELWLNGAKADSSGYGYRYVYHGRDPTETAVSVAPGEPGWRNHGRHQGATFWTALHELVRSPGEVFYRGVRESDDEIEIAFSFRDPGRMAIGMGVEGSWRGYFSRPMRDVTLVIDADRLTPISLSGDGVLVTFADYVEPLPERYAPQRILVEKEGEFWFDWRFAWREPGLWLFESGRRAPSGQVACSVIEFALAED